MKPNTIPRTLATVVLLGSLLMLVPLGAAVASILRGEDVAGATWLIPLVILATGLALMTFLTRMQTFGSQLYVTAFALWILAAVYLFFTR